MRRGFEFLSIGRSALMGLLIDRLLNEGGMQHIVCHPSHTTADQEALCIQSAVRKIVYDMCYVDGFCADPSAKQIAERINRVRGLPLSETRRPE